MDELAKRMMELAEKVGPDAMAAARGAVRVEAYSSMMASAIALVAAVVLAILGYRLFNKGRKEDEEGWMLVGGILLFVALVVFFRGIWGFVDPWVYAAINNPDVWIAKKVLKLGPHSR